MPKASPNAFAATRRDMESVPAFLKTKQRLTSLPSAAKHAMAREQTTPAAGIPGPFRH